MSMDKKELEKKLVESNHRYLDLQQVCDGQASQIEALKTAGLAAKTELLYLTETYFTANKDYARMDNVKRALAVLEDALCQAR